MKLALRFGNVEVLRERREVHVDALRVPLGDRAFDLLIKLIDHRDRIVGKHELLDAVWPDQEVEDGNLHVQVSSLRRLLGAGAITTVHGRGYQFTATLDARIDAAESAPQPVESNPAPFPPIGPELVGRQALLDALWLRLPQCRLLTLVGPGGVGKTRLARALATRAAPAGRWRNGVWWIDLAALDEGHFVCSAVAQGMRLALGDAPAGRPAAEALALQLRAADALLVLDNAEHLAADVRLLVAELLHTAPGLTLLVTSQQALGDPLEQVATVPCLDLPDPAQASDAVGTGALMLFESRARSADPGFALTPANLPSAIQICQRLDGLPLALELAASRIPLLGLHGLLASLDERLQALVQPSSAPGSRQARHQSLRNVLEWSYGLLDPEEKAVLRVLGVIAGPFDLATAEAVAGHAVPGHWRFVDCFEGLVRKSLVAREPTGGQPAWRLLESTRIFALAQLQQCGESEASRKRHAECFASLFEGLDDAWLAGRQPEAEIDAAAGRAMDNLRSALDWACRPGGDTLLAARLLAHGARALYTAGLAAIAQPWHDTVCARLSKNLPPAIEARLRLGWSYATPAGLMDIAVRQASMASAADWFEQQGDRLRHLLALVMLARLAGQAREAGRAQAFIEAAARLERADDPVRLRGLRRAQQLILAVYRDTGQAPAEAELQELLEDYDAAGDSQCRTATLIRIAMAERLLLAGDPEGARDRLRQLCSRVPDGSLGRGAGAFAPLDTLAMAEIACGELDAARESLRQSLDAARSMHTWAEVATVLAWFLAAQGRQRAAAELVGAALAYVQARGRMLDH